MKELLQEMIDAGKEPLLPLEMKDWVTMESNTGADEVCGTSCCLCGDVGILQASRSGSYTMEEAAELAFSFSLDLDDYSEEMFETIGVAESIYSSDSEQRLDAAEVSDIFTEEELQHPHLTTNHHDREIAHDYIRLVMRKVDEKIGEQS
jgi:hypothetical protein